MTFAVAAKNELTFWVTINTAVAAFATFGADEDDAESVGGAAVAAGVALCSGAASVAIVVTEGDGDDAAIPDAAGGAAIVTAAVTDAAIPDGVEIVVAAVPAVVPDIDGEPV